MADHEDEPSSSCLIKQEPAGEGIYASTACSDSRDPKTDQGLTLPPKIQSSDPWLSNAARSSVDDEIGALLGFGQVELLENEPRRDDSWMLTLVEDEYQLPDPPRKKRRLTDLPAPDSNQGAKSASRTPSPAQSDCLASISQTSARSETPQTPSDQGHEVAALDSCSDGDQVQAPSDTDERQPTLDADVKDEPLRADEKRPGETPAEKEAAKEPKQVSPIPLGSGPDGKASRAKPAQRMPTWDADTPIPSIEVNLHQNRLPPNSSRKPSLSASQLSGNSKAKSGVHRDASSSSANVDAGENRDQAGRGKKSECDQQRKRANTAHTPIYSTKHLDYTTSQLFSTFMNLRNSLPITAIMAMVLPPQRTEILQSLAGLLQAQNWISRSGVTQSIAHELPEHLRALFNQVMVKFQTEEQFRNNVMLFIVEALKADCEVKGTNRINMDDILRMGIDQLKTLDEAKQQLLYERKHYHGLLVDMDGEIAVLNDRVQQLEAEIQYVRAKNPHTSSSTANARTNALLGTPQLELDGVPKHNPYWVCCLMLLDGSNTMCHGLNREWHQLHKPGRAGAWTQRRQCYRCGRSNKSNRKYLSDIEAKMLGGVAKTDRVNPYGNQSRISQQSSSRQKPSPPVQRPDIISPTLPAKSSPPVSMGYPPVISQPAQDPFILSPISPVKNTLPVHMDFPSFDTPQPLIITPTSPVMDSATAYTGYTSVNTSQPSVLQATPTPYDALPVIFNAGSGPSVPPANIPKSRVRTAAMGALTFPSIAQEAATSSFQPVLPANIPKMNVRIATVGALTFPAVAPQSVASPGTINSPTSEKSDPDQIDFRQWMGITTMQGNSTNNHMQATQQVYGNGIDNFLQATLDLYGNGQDNRLLAAAQRLYGNGTNNHLQTTQQIYYNDAINPLQATQQTYGNGMNNQSITSTKRPATTPPKSDPPSPKKAKLHPGFNVTNSTQETLRRELQEVQKPWMSPDFTQNESDEASQSDNASLFGEGNDDAASTSGMMSSVFGDEGDAIQTLEDWFVTTQGDSSVQYPPKAVTENIEQVKKLDYETDCELFGEKYANEQRQKEAEKAAANEAGRVDHSDDVDWDALMEADLMAALDEELGYA